MKIQPKMFTGVPHDLRSPLLTVRDHLGRFLQVYCRLAFMLNQARPVINALSREAGGLQVELGQDYLGLGLGGSLARGLGTPETSDVDYFIYVRNIEPRKALEIRSGLESRLRAQGLAPCDANPFHVLDGERLPEPKHGLSVFTNYLVQSPNQAELVEIAAASIKRVLDSGVLGRDQLFKYLTVEFLDLTYNRSDKVVEKYLVNRAREFVNEDAAMALRFSKSSCRVLEQLAAPSISARQRAVPFPFQVAELFS